MSNIEKADAKLINIFFVGEGSFTELLGLPKNRAVRQRLTLTAEIPRLSSDETEDYIRHRLEVAGAKEKIFSAKACQFVYRYSNGVPLEINKICDAALKLGATQEEVTITPGLVESAFTKVDLPTDSVAIPIQGDGPFKAADAYKDYSQFNVGDGSHSVVSGFNVESESRSGWFKYGFAALILVVVAGYFYKSSRAPVVKVDLPPAVVEQVEVKQPKKLPVVPRSPAVTVLEENKGDLNQVKAVELKSAILEKAYEDMPGGDTVSEASSEVASERDAVSEAIDSQQAEIVVETPAAAQQDITPENEIAKETGGVETGLVEVASGSGTEEIEQVIPAPEPVEQMPPLEPRKVLLPLRANSLKLTNEGTKRLNSFVETLLDYPKATILVKGFVSSKSNSPENIQLSENRAMAIYKMMLKKGVDPEQIEMEGMGNREPIASNDTRAGRAKNRRVEILVISDGL